ncbi:MAG: tagaturonate reductase [Bacteroidales bacterium]|jgi:tagaturonate reductase
MKTLTRGKAKSPERIIQFGEGNFLRAFVDWIIYRMNEKVSFNSSVVVVQPIETGMSQILNNQDGLYHLNMQGIHDGAEIDTIEMIDVISRAINPYSHFEDYSLLALNPDIRFIISNTTEAGIVFDKDCKINDTPPRSYPGKLTQLLYNRFVAFNGSDDKGLIIFPCELIFRNGDQLRKCIYQYAELWNLGSKFTEWFNVSCGVYNTLVDRIVPGYPKETINTILSRIGYDDKLVVKSEIFLNWVIEAPTSVASEFPADKIGLNVRFVEDENPYHELKVRLLNGSHTLLSPVGFLAGKNTVKDCMDDELICKYVRKVMFDELSITIDLPEKHINEFANNVIERFQNPYIKHLVTSIMLNSFSKFKTRDLPGLLIYADCKKELPKGIVLGLAAIITYYKGGKRGDSHIVLNDDRNVIDLLKKLWSTNNLGLVAEGVLEAEFIWGLNLNTVEGLTETLHGYLQKIQSAGMREVINSIV